MQKSRRQADYDYIKQVSDSQNFLTDSKLLQRIIRSADIQKGDMVLEIGTGKGHLTEALCKRAGKVCSVEVDERLMERAKKGLSKYENVELVSGDFMKYRLPEKGDYKVFANIPFFLTTQIVEKLTQRANAPTDMWLVMEKGAAKRFMGLLRETKKSLELKVRWGDVGCVPFPQGRLSSEAVRGLCPGAFFPKSRSGSEWKGIPGVSEIH